MKERTIYALGFFDGVHLGHQALLAQCCALAREQGCRAGVITFDTHPELLVSGKTPALINTADQRRQLLHHYGAQDIDCLPFDRALMCCPWERFFTRLVEEFNAAGIVCGSDFRFGYGGLGDAGKLQEACREAGILCAVVPQQMLEGVRISSTHIRSLLEQGQMEQAVRFLGHPHLLSGEVVSGRQLGRTIGVPTANLLLPREQLLPRLGVYAAKAEVAGKAYTAMVNIGTRPTVDGGGVTVEVNLLDFTGELYGQQLKIWLYHFLRPEKKFPDLGSLRREIEENRGQILDFFEKK